MVHNNRYLASEAFTVRLAQSNWQAHAAPLLYNGPWSSDILKLAAGTSVLCPGQVREGIVICPAHERFDPRTGRVILKALNDHYLLRQDATEFH